MRVTIKPAARSDILAAYIYFLDLDRPDVAERFAASLDATIEALKAVPKAGSPTYLRLQN